MIRKFLKEDAASLKQIIQSIDLFTDQEKVVAVELIDEVYYNPANEYYFIYVYIHDDNIAGYYCLGERPLTDGVYDLYWIAVTPSLQGQGIGINLLKHAEETVNKKSGRLLLAETSSKLNYSLTRKFYINNGYKNLATIKDFYKPEDDLVIFGKYINN